MNNLSLEAGPLRLRHSYDEVDSVVAVQRCYSVASALSHAFGTDGKARSAIGRVVDDPTLTILQEAAVACYFQHSF